MEVNEYWNDRGAPEQIDQFKSVNLVLANVEQPG
jgi:hypothetical protein